MNRSRRNFITSTSFLYEDAFLDFNYGNSHPESPKRLLAIDHMMRQNGLYAKVTRLASTVDALPSIKYCVRST